MRLSKDAKSHLIYLLINLSILGLLYKALEVAPKWEVVIQVLFFMFAFNLIHPIWLVLDDLIGQERHTRYVWIFLPTAIMSFLITGCSAALEDKHFSWSPFPGYFIMCLIFWYLGAAFHTFIFEQKIARCPTCELEAFCPRCDKEYFDKEMTWGEYLDKKKDK